MGISRDSRHKRSATGAKRAHYREYNHSTRTLRFRGWEGTIP